MPVQLECSLNRRGGAVSTDSDRHGDIALTETRPLVTVVRTANAVGAVIDNDVPRPTLRLITELRRVSPSRHVLSPSSELGVEMELGLLFCFKVV